MKNYLLKWMRCNLTLLFFFILIETCKADTTEDSNILEVAKRNLLCREKEYLKSAPLSENLKNFIKRFKRKARLLQLEKLKANKGNASELAMRRVRVADDSDTSISQESTTLVSTSHVSKSSLPSSSVQSSESSTTLQNNGHSSSAGTTNSGPSTESTNQSSLVSSCKNGDDDKSGELVTDEYDTDSEETTTQKKELLGKVMKDVQELIRYENAAKTSEGDASLCNITGDWDSFAGGMQIRFFNRFHPQAPNVKIVPQEPPMNGFLTESSWNATSLVPFKHSSLVALTAVSNKGKKIANFLGECRICEGSESITGHWMVRRRSKNCKDREEANTFISDVLRKNNVRKLRKEHLNQVSTSSNLDADLSE
ncbi:unnamed protein product [Psylliodes chrysocephalus]|uniref:Uncharacterized protein n=1 Tax=Psylliodes chrysocephalus TaxID=3402493 RepID=A0A9P0G6T5_9CUCU|nr:unnamed protein product [Psylliodes chrysocephala]